MRLLIRRLCLVAILLSSNAGAQGPAASLGPQIDSLNAAARAGDFVRALRHVEIAVALQPANIPILDQLVRTRGRLRDSLGVLAALERILPDGGTRPVRGDPIFTFMASNARFVELGARLDRTLRSTGSVETVRVLNPGVGLGEGIAARPPVAGDSGTLTIFGGGGARGGVTRLRLSADGASTSTAVETGGSLLGMKVDARGHLWANVSYPMPEGRTRSEVVVIDVGRGAITRRMRSPSDGRSHLFNDLALAPDGTVYVTDSDASTVYVVRAGTRDSIGDVEVFFSGAEDVRGTNGVATSPDGRWLYVAHLFGLEVWHLASGQRSRVQTRVGWPVESFDGLYACGSALVGVQTLPGADRIVWLEMDSMRRRVRQWRVLAQTRQADGVLSTGAPVGRHLYVHLRRTAAPGVGGDATAPVRTVLQRVRLPRAC